MKSAAFNLAFKVHRNEMPFAEGLVKSVEEQAQEDFIHALNSLAGETKYDVDQLDGLVEEAMKGLEPNASEPSIDIKGLQEEVRVLQKKRRDYLDGIETLENQNASFAPSITPGINSFLLGIVGGIIFLILLLLGLGISSLFVLIGTMITVVILVAIDLSKLNQEKEEIARKKQRNNEQIKKIKSELAEVEIKLEEKENLLNSVQPPKTETPQTKTSSHDPSSLLNLEEL